MMEIKFEKRETKARSYKTSVDTDNKLKKVISILENKTKANITQEEALNLSLSLAIKELSNGKK